MLVRVCGQVSKGISGGMAQGLGGHATAGRLRCRVDHRGQWISQVVAEDRDRGSAPLSSCWQLVVSCESRLALD